MFFSDWQRILLRAFKISGYHIHFTFLRNRLLPFIPMPTLQSVENNWPTSILLSLIRRRLCAEILWYLPL
jgi:hypothetical protein